MTRRGLFTIITGAIAGLKAARKPLIYLKARAVGFTIDRSWRLTEAQSRVLDYMYKRDRPKQFSGGKRIRTPFFYNAQE